MDNKELGADPALVNGAAKSVSTLTGFDQGESAILNDIAIMMSEFVDNWPQPKRLDTALALVAKTLRAALTNAGDEA